MFDCILKQTLNKCNLNLRFKSYQLYQLSGLTPSSDATCFP